MRTIASALRPERRRRGDDRVERDHGSGAAFRRAALRGARNDRDALVEPFAARLGRHVRVVAQRDVHDAPLDRRHRRQQLLAPAAAHAVRDFLRAAREVFVRADP